MEIYSKYYKLREEIDGIIRKLIEIHHSEINCKSGCSSCCENFSILPVEFYSIKNEIEKFKISTEIADKNSCKFLINNKCSIYKSRPVICRTQGVPLLFMSEDYNFELSVCDLNFSDFDFQKFNSENTYSLDTYNSELFMLNKEFIENFDRKYSEFELISINEL